MNESKSPETLQEAMVMFGTPWKCHDYLVEMRWGGKVICPRCQSDRVGKFSGKRMVSNCKDCRKQFTAKVGTIFEDSPLPLSKWMPAVWMIVNAKNGISSYEIHRALGVTQKTAWHMGHRIRKAVQNGSIVKLDGEVEADETYIGGKARNMHRAKRDKVVNRQTGGLHMTPVQGLLQRTGKASKVLLKVAHSTDRMQFKNNVKEYVLKGSTVYTDNAHHYKRISDNNEYVHHVVDHAVQYVNGKVHTNGLENFWSLLKRGIKGTYVHVEPFHLFRYLDEQAYRFNERAGNDGERFAKAVQGLFGKRLTYAELTGKAII